VSARRYLRRVLRRRTWLSKDIASDLRLSQEWLVDVRTHPDAERSGRHLMFETLVDVDLCPPRASDSPEIQLTLCLMAGTPEIAERVARRLCERCSVPVYACRSRRS
jgi:hypothetical protein